MYLTVSSEHNLLLQNDLILNRNTKLQTNVENCVPFRRNEARLRVTLGEHSHQVSIVAEQLFQQSWTASNARPFVWTAVRSHKTLHRQNLISAEAGLPFSTVTNTNLLF